MWVWRKGRGMGVRCANKKSAEVYFALCVNERLFVCEQLGLFV